MGAHYAMDVLGGRVILSTYDLAQLLANKSRYVGVKRGDVSIEDYQQAFAAARNDIVAALEKACGDRVAVCARRDQKPLRRRGKEQKVLRIYPDL